MVSIAPFAISCGGETQTNTGGAGGMGGSGGAGGDSCASLSCDDKNPCTKDACQGGQCVHTPDDTATPPSDGNECTKNLCSGGEVKHAPVGADTPCGTGGTLKCSATGQCVGCTNNNDCGTSTDCLIHTCLPNQTCEITYVSQGTMLADPTPNDCKGMACDGMGSATPVNLNTDLPLDDGDECTSEACVAGIPDYPVKAAGTPCMGDKVCNAVGACVTCAGTNLGCPSGSFCYLQQYCFSCNDGVKNGDETGVDCGGSCPRCLGALCTANTQCASGFCVDGVCCSTACDTPCQACNIANKLGTCFNLPKGTPDPGICDAAGEACTGSGSCAPTNGLKMLGEACTTNAECFSGICVAGNICGLSVGDTCGAHYPCSTKLCFNNVCTTCNGNSQCDSKECFSNTNCAIPPGELCTPSLMNPAPVCMTGTTCQGQLCKLPAGAACINNASCDGFCDQVTKTCSPCATSAQCNGGTCQNGACFLPVGSSCLAGSQCLSGVCAGFPPKCQ